MKGFDKRIFYEGHIKEVPKAFRLAPTRNKEQDVVASRVAIMESRPSDNREERFFRFQDEKGRNPDGFFAAMIRRSGEEVHEASDEL
jgi:hypothetical protein